MTTSTVYTSDRVTGGNNQIYDAVFTDKNDNSTLTSNDFIKLMMTQLQNQDFTNPSDTSDMLNQMTQLSNMQMMQEMAGYSKLNYAMSLVGKTVTASRFTLSGELDTVTDVISSVSINGDEYVFLIGGKKYTMNQIMTIGGTPSTDDTTEEKPDDKEDENTSTEETDKV